ncbi:conserved hypothetical protein [Leishmania mexicana MHOM/GT/2001/U1103]|uniref:Uncharacterized protein n=1 Tax=Leishmania mexicana (strain MHOM/GT/2001/U1103) TaxID=929439 RepID=E9AN62_LEIMU|nr:conserved hypothetical protein [Leishmania mexicana MHOM/GT/2001/U1103]CBZ24368.1 conserved hypothetical protein [Leishmania mexicana MHOM/GT/2001/U1103]
MLRIILQRLAVQRRIAEQLEAVSLDEVLRRMQSSSLTNPARSLEAHFVLATERRDHERAAPTAASTCAETLMEPSSDLLRNALSERLLAEVRRDLSSPTITLDDGGLMLANCLRHGLSPLATQQVFALWQRRMHHPTTGASSAAAPRTSISMFGMGTNHNAFARAGGGAAGVSDLARFQSLVRVMEACLDAHDKQQRELGRSQKRTSSAAAAAATADARKPPSKSCTAFTLDDLAALVDTVEQHWRLFIDHGTSTTGLLVQFTALALVLTGCASSAAAEAEPGSNFVNSLRRLSHLQTDRALLQQRIFSLCDQAIVSLCSQEEAASAAGDGGIPPRRESLWWYRPQELVRLSQAMRLIEVYEAEQRRGSRYSSSTGSPVEHSSHGEGDGLCRLGSSAARTSWRDAGKTMPSSSNPVRGTPPSRAHTVSAFPKTRWLLRLPTTWWPASSTSLHGASVGHRKTEAAVRARRRLGAYVTHHALQHTSTVTPPPVPSHAVLPALASISLADVEDIFAVVCATASSVASTDAVTAFSWWVRDVFLQQHRHRSLHDVQEIAGLLGIAEVCIAYPDGTQTVLAEALRCLQRSALVLWCVGDTAVTSGGDAPGMLWSRACEVVGDALALTTVRAEAQRTLRALAHTVSQPASSCMVTRESSSELARRHQRYGLLVLACLQLQSPGGTITPALKRMILELIFSAPFRRDDADHGGPAAVARALFVVTRPERTLRGPASTQGSPLHERVIPHLLNELSQLFSPSAATLKDGATATVGDGRDSAQLLQQLTSAERQMLRSALQEVRRQTQHEMKERPVWGPVLAPSGSETGPRQAARTAPLQLPLSLPVPAHVGVISSVDASTLSSDRQAGAVDAESGLSRPCTESHERALRHRMHASEEHQRIQSEIDTLTRYLRQRRSPG